MTSTAWSTIFEVISRFSTLVAPFPSETSVSDSIKRIRNDVPPLRSKPNGSFSAGGLTCNRHRATSKTVSTLPRMRLARSLSVKKYQPKRPRRRRPERNVWMGLIAEKEGGLGDGPAPSRP